jgi:hypothetical protein
LFSPDSILASARQAADPLVGLSTIKTYDPTYADLRIYAKMYEDYDKRFYGFKSISGSMNYSMLIDTLVMAIGDTDTLSLGFGRQGRFEVADAMEKWVKMRTKHLTTILITGRYDTADRRLFDSEQLKMVRNAKKPDDLSDILVDFKDIVGLTFSVE